MNDLNKTEQYRAEIKAWMESDKDFDQGYALFVRFSHNKTMAVQLARKRDPGLLEYQVSKILDMGVIIERPVMNIAVVRTVIVKEQKKQEVLKAPILEVSKKVERTFAVGEKYTQEDFESFTDEQKTLFNLNRDMYKEMRSWHEKMKLAMTDEERATCRAEVLSLDKEIRANWEKFDNGSSKKEPEESDPVKAVSNARAFLSKNLPKMDVLEGKKRATVAAKIKERYLVIIEAKQSVDDETIAKLKACGIVE